MGINANEQNISKLTEGKLSPNWKWDTSPFIDIVKYKLAPIPSYYDAPMPDKMFILNGPMGNTFNLEQSNYIIEDKTRSANPYLSLTPGTYSILGKRKAIFPNQSVKMPVTTANQLLPLKPDFSFAPELALFSRESDIVTISKSWVYDKSIIDNTRYRIDTDISGNSVIKLSNTQTENQVVTVQKSSYRVSLKNNMNILSYSIFFLPLFPALNIIVSNATNSYKYDSFNGIVFVPSNLNVTSIDVTYISTPLLSYVPEVAALKSFILPFNKTIGNTSYFVSIENKGHYGSLITDQGGEPIK